MVPKNLKHKQVTTTSGTSFLGLFYHINPAVILIITQSLPRMTASE